MQFFIVNKKIAMLAYSIDCHAKLNSLKLLFIYHWNSLNGERRRDGFLFDGIRICRVSFRSAPFLLFAHWESCREFCFPRRPCLPFPFCSSNRISAQLTETCILLLIIKRVIYFSTPRRHPPFITIIFVE